MRYKSFYQLLQVGIVRGDTTVYPDIVFTPTRQTAVLLTRNNLQASSGQGRLSVFYRAFYEALPAERKEQQISFDNIHLYFTFQTRNQDILDALYNTAPPGTGADPSKSVFTLTDVQRINNGLDAMRINKYPAVFTHTVFDTPGRKKFEIFKDGNALPENAIYQRSIISDDAGRYSCTADLSDYPAGFYTLNLEGLSSYEVYIDTQHELPGQTGLLELVLTDYNYTNSSNSSPPVSPVQSAISINYTI